MFDVQWDWDHDQFRRMKKIMVVLALLSLGAWARADFLTDTPQNGNIYLATPTALKVTLTNSQNKNFVVLNDDAENTLYYGDANCSSALGQKIQPMEKVVFAGVPNPFNLYVCTETGSAEVRVVEQ